MPPQQQDPQVQRGAPSADDEEDWWSDSGNSLSPAVSPLRDRACEREQFLDGEARKDLQVHMQRALIHSS